MKGGIIIAIPMPGLQALRLGLAAATLALAAGCGHTHIVGSGRTVGLGLSEYRMVPQDVRAPVGVLNILIHNYGRLTHNLVVSQGGHEVAGTKPIPPGTTAYLSVNLARGNYVMASTLLSDQSLGEYGTLIVR
jgi:hypothetical protein